MNENNKLEKLVNELSLNRKGLYNILERIINFRNKLEVLIPDNKDYRNKHLMEERMKTFTEIIKTELSVHTNIDNNIKNEVDIRRKIEMDRDEDEKELSNIDIRHIANEVESRIKKIV